MVNKLKGKKCRPHIVMIIPRGEAVRNFLYSDTLKILHENARVTILTVIHDDEFLNRFGPFADQIIPLKEEKEHRLVVNFRLLLHEAHFRWLWSKVAQNVWEIRADAAKTTYQSARWQFFRAWANALANRKLIEKLTEAERNLSFKLRPSNDLVNLFAGLKPDLVFNGSHIHGPAGELPVKIAHRMGIPTVGFIFSWDNLTSRSRIFVPYEYFLVWHEGMKKQLMSIYPKIPEGRVIVTGTPQFDFHFKPDYQLSKEELARKIGIDPSRPFIFYTTGIDRHFPEEHRHVEFIANFLNQNGIRPKPQLLVRTYVKGTSQEMKALSRNLESDVIFPKVAWDDKWFMPKYEDLAIYTSCVKHATMGINAASTVSLELMMFDKPVMNIGFDPPGCVIPHAYRWERHIEFDHFKPVAESGGVMVSYSKEDMQRMIMKGLTEPECGRQERRRFIQRIFGSTLDGNSGARVGERLLSIAKYS